MKIGYDVFEKEYGYLFSYAAKDILKSRDLDELGDYKK